MLRYLILKLIDKDRIDRYYLLSNLGYINPSPVGLGYTVGVTYTQNTNNMLLNFTVDIRAFATNEENRVDNLNNHRLSHSDCYHVIWLFMTDSMQHQVTGRKCYDESELFCWSSRVAYP